MFTVIGSHVSLNLVHDGIRASTSLASIPNTLDVNYRCRLVQNLRNSENPKFK